MIHVKQLTHDKNAFLNNQFYTLDATHDIIIIIIMCQSAKTDNTGAVEL